MKENVAVSGVQQLKNEFRTLRDELKESGLITHEKFEGFVIESHPEYDSKEGRKRIYNAYYGRCSDLNMMNHLRAYQQENQTI